MRSPSHDSGMQPGNVQSFDVTVIGGGLAGMAASLHLAKAGFRVVCIEPETGLRQAVGESLDWASPALLGQQYTCLTTPSALCWKWRDRLEGLFQFGGKQRIIIASLILTVMLAAVPKIQRKLRWGFGDVGRDTGHLLTKLGQVSLGIRKNIFIKQPSPEKHSPSEDIGGRYTFRSFAPENKVVVFEGRSEREWLPGTYSAKRTFDLRDLGPYKPVFSETSGKLLCAEVMHNIRGRSWSHIFYSHFKYPRIDVSLRGSFRERSGSYPTKYNKGALDGSQRIAADLVRIEHSFILSMGSAGVPYKDKESDNGDGKPKPVWGFPVLFWMGLGIIVTSYSGWQLEFRIQNYRQLFIWFSALIIGLAFFGYGVNLHLDRLKDLYEGSMFIEHPAQKIIRTELHGIWVSLSVPAHSDCQPVVNVSSLVSPCGLARTSARLGAAS